MVRAAADERSDIPYVVRHIVGIDWHDSAIGQEPSPDRSAAVIADVLACHTATLTLSSAIGPLERALMSLYFRWANDF